jgi:hypothetical protein
MSTKKSNILWILITLLGILPTNGKAQLMVDAGKDTTFCTGQNIESLQLGTNVKIENGKEPNAIAWECKIPRGSDSYFTASDLLSDTTILSPYFLYNPVNVEWIKFTLHVTDSENKYSKDSIYIRFSKFGYLTGGGQTIFFIEKGDSILLNINNVGIGGNIPPLTYYWQPRTYLSKPDSSITWCKPDSSVQYRSVAIDSCGCISYPQMVYDIRVLTTGLDDVGASKDNILNIRQNGTKLFFHNPLKGKAHFTFYSINGNFLYNCEINDDNLEISQLLEYKGIFIVKISVRKLTGNSKIINY